MTEQAEHGKGGVYSSEGKEYTRDSRYITTRITVDCRDRLALLAPGDTIRCD